jgi:hypothetical protein
LFLQSRLYWFTFATIAASIAVWFITMFIVDSNVAFSFFDFFAVFREITGTGNFWLTTILLCTLIIGKDMYLCALERGFNYKDYQLIQEMEAKGSDGAGVGLGKGGVEAKRSAAKSLNVQAGDADVHV